MTKVVKMSVNLPASTVKVLKELAGRRGVTMTDVLRQAISTEKFIDDVHEGEGKVLVEDNKGRIRQLVFR
jgi:predicted DNA-binding protein